MALEQLQQRFGLGIATEGRALGEIGDLEDIETFVENGWEAYAVGLGAWCALFPCAGLLNTIGTFQTYVGLHQLQSYSD